MNEYKIVWENNSKAKSLVYQGRIKLGDIIPKTTTGDFPAETATVRIQDLLSTKPRVTIHIKGKKIVRSYFNGSRQANYDSISVLRASCTSGSQVSFNGSTSVRMSDVAYVVDYVKEKMGYV